MALLAVPGICIIPAFDALGLDVETRNAGAADQAGQVQDGLLDAFAFASGMPVSAFSQLEAQADVNIFSFSPMKSPYLPSSSLNCLLP